MPTRTGKQGDEGRREGDKEGERQGDVGRGRQKERSGNRGGEITEQTYCWVIVALSFNIAKNVNIR